MKTTLNRSIAIVSASRETLDGVEAYLRRAGARTTPVAQITDTTAMPDVDAVILFADDFPRTAALDACARFKRGTGLLVVVTDDVEAFTPPRAAAAKVVVLRRPAWGWMLIDALRIAPPAHT